MDKIEEIIDKRDIIMDLPNSEAKIILRSGNGRDNEYNFSLKLNEKFPFEGNIIYHIIVG